MLQSSTQPSLFVTVQVCWTNKVLQSKLITPGSMCTLHSMLEVNSVTPMEDLSITQTHSFMTSHQHWDHKTVVQLSQSMELVSIRTRHAYSLLDLVSLKSSQRKWLMNHSSLWLHHHHCQVQLLFLSLLMDSNSRSKLLLVIYQRNWLMITMKLHIPLCSIQIEDHLMVLICRDIKVLDICFQDLIWTINYGPDLLIWRLMHHWLRILRSLVTILALTNGHGTCLR